VGQQHWPKAFRISDVGLTAEEARQRILDDCTGAFLSTHAGAHVGMYVGFQPTHVAHHELGDDFRLQTSSGFRIGDDRCRVLEVVERQGVESNPAVFRDALADSRGILLGEEFRLQPFQVLPQIRFLVKSPQRSS